MSTPSLLQIDDRDPLVFYSPNSSWTRGGNVSDFDGTSTFTDATGASATLTFTGTGISVWGTIQFLQPNAPTYVLSSYSVDGGPSTIFNATEAATYQFQQKLFQSATLTDSASHTLVVTLVNNGTLYLDYFLVIPSTSTTTSSSSAGASSSNPSSVTGTMMVGGVGSSTLSSTLSTTTGAGAQSQSNRVTIGAAVGGSLGGLALLIIAVLAVFFCRKRRKDKNLPIDVSQAQVHPVPFITPASPMQQYQPYEGSDRVSEYPSFSQHPSPPTSASGIIPSSKGAQLSILNPSRPGEDSLHSRHFSESPEPPGYNE